MEVSKESELPAKEEKGRCCGYISIQYEKSKKGLSRLRCHAINSLYSLLVFREYASVTDPKSDEFDACPDMGHSIEKIPKIWLKN